MRVPLLDLKAQYAGIRAEIKSAIDEVLESQSFILGPKVKDLESAIATYAQTEYAVGVSSGTDALLVALMALDIRPGDEVITTPFTFFATAGVIVRLGAIPVFVDIDPATFNIDPARIEKAITPRTKAILPVHLFGQCADMSPILETAARHEVPVVEDAAQSLGAEYQGKKAGSMGDLGTFSFFPSKNLGGFGDGGMVTTRHAELVEKIRLLRHHGEGGSYEHKYVGGNFRLDALQAAVLSVKLRHLENWTEARIRNAAYYSARFKELGLLDGDIVAPPVLASGAAGGANRHIYNQYTLSVKNRDGLRAHLTNAGIGTAVYYPIPLHLQECFKNLGYAKGAFPESEKAAQEVLSIPVYPELTRDQKDYVVRTIYAYFQGKSASSGAREHGTHE